VKTSREALHFVLALLRIGGDVKRDNRKVLRIYQDLTTWARDDLRKEAQALTEMENDLAARRMLKSGSRGFHEERIRDEVAERWRNRKRQATREIEDIQDAETALHRRYRRLRSKPWPENPDQGELEKITGEWEKRLGLS
jgi:thioesterase domain-containing protein